VQAARDAIADVVRLARVGADDRLDVLGPPPAGFEGVPADLAACDLHDLDGGLLRATDLVR